MYFPVRNRHCTSTRKFAVQVNFLGLQLASEAQLERENAMEVERWRLIRNFTRDPQGAVRATIAIPTQLLSPFLVDFLTNHQESIAYIHIFAGDREKALRLLTLKLEMLIKQCV